MARWSDDEADWDDDLDSDLDEEADDLAEDSEEPTVPCPYCGKPIPEDTLRCPYCENYVSREDALPRRKPWWIVLGVLTGLYAVYRWIAG